MLSLALTLLLVSQCYSADLVETLAGDPIASTLVQLVQKAGLTDVLKSGTFTIFAPTDGAFNKVPAATLTSLLSDQQALSNLLKYHVVTGGHRSADLFNEETFTTASGEKVRINVYTHNNIVTVNGAKVTDADKAASNGYIHYIDSVIMPPVGSVVDAVRNDPDLSTLYSAIGKAGIADKFTTDPLTVFAPTNDAFARLNQNDLNKLLGSPDRLAETLRYHEVAHTLYSKGMWNHEYPKSTDSNEDRLHIRVDSSDVSINNAKVTTADISVTNGVVHKIDHVLIPIRVGIWLRFNNGK
ncbi:transforming growth factor-beta-induced protein ig-h3 [Plakobranchus ocellatus]|uniref:Transforming growth factor-beta-induced protein ig-h3 n=1 Tax=Plakobranchus ocellatus TaxID=259542 RepID=A0AAV3XZC7_9GAST|nr:transforming growth factor-beta-induced protein ig-h3 [Plakobranchus ocellatus]